MLEASLEPGEAPPLILALARRLHHRSLNLTTPDLFRYATLLPDGSAHPGLDPAHFVVYSDTPAGARQLLQLPLSNNAAPGSSLVEAVTTHRACFQLIHVTDQNLSPLTYASFGGDWVETGGNVFVFDPPLALNAHTPHTY